jgi:hypothetical protein
MSTPDKVLIRDYKLFVNTGTVEVPVWTQVKGLTDPLAITSNVGETELRDQDDAGWSRTWPTSRSYEFAAKGFRMEAADGARDPGQEAVEAVSEEMGEDAVLQYKVVSPGAASIIFDAWATVTEFGGSEDDAATWEAALKVNGQPARA